MNNFLTQLPIIIATLSKAVLKAIKEQILEVARIIQKVIQSLWLIYHNIESSILGTIVDVSFSIIALRYFLALIAVGVIFLYLSWWWALFIYVVVIIVAIVRFFSMPTEGTGIETEVHIKRKEKIVGFLRWPLRILFSLIMLFITRYSFFGKIDFINQYSIFQGNSSKNQSAPTVVIEPNNTQQPFGQSTVSTPTIPPTVIVEPNNTQQPSGQSTVSTPTIPPTVIVEPNNTQQPSGQSTVSTPTIPPTVIVEPNNTQQQEPETLYVNTQTLILREGPGKEYNELDKIFYGDAVIATETSVSRDGGNWVKVKSGNFEGWLNKKYLSVTQLALLRSLGPVRGPCFRRCFYKFSRRYMRMSSKLCFLHWRFFRASWMFLILFQINIGGNVE